MKDEEERVQAEVEATRRAISLATTAGVLALFAHSENQLAVIEAFRAMAKEAEQRLIEEQPTAIQLTQHQRVFASLLAGFEKRLR